MRGLYLKKQSREPIQLQNKTAKVNEKEKDKLDKKNEQLQSLAKLAITLQEQVPI